MTQARESLVTPAEARERIRLLYVAAARTADDPTLVEPLILHTGLSRPGVELALRDHVERDLDAALQALAGWHLPYADEATVVLAANVFVATFRAVLVASLSASRVEVRASRREPVFSRAFVHHARELGASWLALTAVV